MDRHVFPRLTVFEHGSHGSGHALHQTLKFYEVLTTVTESFLWRDISHTHHAMTHWFSSSDSEVLRWTLWTCQGLQFPRFRTVRYRDNISPPFTQCQLIADEFLFRLAEYPFSCYKGFCCPVEHVATFFDIPYIPLVLPMPFWCRRCSLFGKWTINIDTLQLLSWTRKTVFLRWWWDTKTHKKNLAFTILQLSISVEPPSSASHVTAQTSVNARWWHVGEVGEWMHIGGEYWRKMMETSRSSRSGPDSQWPLDRIDAFWNDDHKGRADECADDI